MAINPKWTTPTAGELATALGFSYTPAVNVPAASADLNFLPYSESGRIGSGFNAISGSWARRAFPLEVVKAAESESLPGGGFYTTYSLDWVRTRDQLSRVLNLDVYASANYGAGSGNASLSQMQTQFSERFSHYVAANIRVEAAPIRLDDSEFDPTAKAMLNEEARFTGAFGTHFATAVIRGGYLSVVWQIYSENEEEYNAVSAHLSGSIRAVGGNGAEAKADFFSSVRTLRERFSVKASIVRDGLRGKVPPMSSVYDIENFLRYVEAFPAAISAQEEKSAGSVILGFVMQAASLYGAPAIGPRLRTSRRLLNAKMMADAALADLAYASQNGQEWVPPLDTQVIAEGANHIASYIGDVVTHIEMCAEGAEGWELPNDSPLFKAPGRPVFHGRSQWIDFHVRDKYHKIGTLSEGEHAYVAFDDGVISAISHEGIGSFQPQTIAQLGYTNPPETRPIRIVTIGFGAMGTATTEATMQGEPQGVPWSPDLILHGPCEVWRLWLDPNGNYKDNFNLGKGIKMVLYRVTETAPPE